MFRENKNSYKILAAQILCALAILVLPHAACADTQNYLAPLTPALEQALSSDQHFNLYAPNAAKGFNLSSAYFSGDALGIPQADNANALTNDQKLYAMLVDGRYDFNYEAPGLSSPLRPYLMGGVGVATLGHDGFADLNNTPNSDAVPLLHLGGGVAYRLGEQWDLSLDYKAGRAALSSGDEVFTGRSQQQVDMQELNLGMSYAF